MASSAKETLDGCVRASVSEACCNWDGNVGSWDDSQEIDALWMQRTVKLQEVGIRTTRINDCLVSSHFPTLKFLSTLPSLPSLFT